MRKVLIGTPAYDGKVDVWFAHSLVQTIKLSIEKGIQVNVIYPSYDSLVQRARNDLIKIALDGEYDDLFFIDSDVEWEPEWFFNILSRSEPLVGGALVKKSVKEDYTVKLLNKELIYSFDKKLIEVDGVGTGFLKVNKFALQKLWDISEPYSSINHESCRMVFDIKVENGELVSEDYILCNKWKSLGYKVWLDPTITCNHIGTKKYIGNINKFLDNNGFIR